MAGSDTIEPKARTGGNEEIGAQKDDIPIEDEKLIQTAVHTDIAHGLYLESLTMDPEHRAALAAKVRRKLDMIVLPAVSPHTYACTSTAHRTSH